MNKRARHEVNKRNYIQSKKFLAVGKPREAIEYIYHVSTLDYSHLDEAHFELKLPYINHVQEIEIMNAYVPANLDSFHGKKLVFSIVYDLSNTITTHKFEVIFENDMGLSNPTQRKILTEKIKEVCVINSTFIFTDAKIESGNANDVFKLILTKNISLTGTINQVSFRWDDQTKEESLKNTLGFHGEGDYSDFKEDQASNTWSIESPSQCNWVGHNFLILRTPSVNIDSSFATENPPPEHTNVLAILHTPHERMGVHFNKNWFRPILVRNIINSLHTFVLQVYHEDGRLVRLNGGQFFFTLKIVADSY